MTTLNSFAKAADTVADHLGKYYATRDPNELTAAIEVLQEQITVLQGEMSEPQLQETTVTLTRMRGQDLLDGFQKNNALCLRNEEYLADGPISEGKLLRIKAYSGIDLNSSENPFNDDADAIYLTKVTALTDSALILAPVIAS